MGARNYPEWGPIILIGLGGVVAEVLADVRLIPPDLPQSAIAEELLQLKCASLLTGHRGSPPLDIAAAATSSPKSELCSARTPRSPKSTSTQSFSTPPVRRNRPQRPHRGIQLAFRTRRGELMQQLQQKRALH